MRWDRQGAEPIMALIALEQSKHMGSVLEHPNNGGIAMPESLGAPESNACDIWIDISLYFTYNGIWSQ